MNGNDLLKKIGEGEYIFHNQSFETDISINPAYSDEKLITLTFINCIFNQKLEIQNIEDTRFSIIFIECIFTQILIQNCKISKLEFSSTKKFENLKIHDSIFNELSIIGDNKFSFGEINISRTNIVSNLNCYGLNIKKGDFSLNHGTELTQQLNINFSNTRFEQVHFRGFFGEHSSFSNLKANKCSFSYCTFGAISFILASIKESASFNDCNFTYDVNFRKSNNNGLVKFSNCRFEGYSHFNESKFFDLDIMSSIFEKKASFERLEVDTFNLYQTTFNQGAFFDEFKINKITDAKIIRTWTPEIAGQWRQTLRAVKQELQKAENKIDYNRFRAYELSAYYQELNWKWKGDFKDKFILWATKYVTGFDHSWRKALRFTLIASLIFYSLFFVTENYIYPFDIRFTREFLSGAFRFLLVTDFYNPLENGREYINSTNTLGWFIFILGKIVIAFGIYEMIQAFRKFKA